MDANTIGLYSLYVSVIGVILTVVIPVLQKWRNGIHVLASSEIQIGMESQVKIEITNLSATPIIIQKWDLVARKNFILYVRYSLGIIDNYQVTTPFEVNSNSVHRIILPRAYTNYFTGLVDIGGTDVYIQLHIAGVKEPRWIFLADLRGFDTSKTGSKFSI